MHKHSLLHELDVSHKACGLQQTHVRGVGVPEEVRVYHAQGALVSCDTAVVRVERARGFIWLGVEEEELRHSGRSFKSWRGVG